MIKKILLFAVFTVFINIESHGQCAAITQNACAQAAPTVIGNNITCTTPATNGGRENFQVTNMLAGATYRVSNCSSGIDTQMTIRDTGGTSARHRVPGRLCVADGRRSRSQHQGPSSTPPSAPSVAGSGHQSGRRP